jgi:hydroxyacylglutathione hydrolase
VQQLGMTVLQVLHTHAHFDHFLASGEIYKATRAPLCVHPADRELWEILEEQCRLFGVPYSPVPFPHTWLRHEERIEIGNVDGVALHTPGHSPGSMCFYFEDDQLVLSGDTLFYGSIGRTDLWGGDAHAIVDSIRARLYRLPDSTRVVPGHGPETVIGFEREHNAFVTA